MNVARGQLDGGILITGSHMPPERIGLIVTLGDGSYAPPEVTDRLLPGKTRDVFAASQQLDHHE